jgi:hypothetical protein
MPIASQRVDEHVPAAMTSSVARQRRRKRTFAAIEEAVFSMGPPRDYIKSLVVERERSEALAVKEEGFGWRLIVS